MEALDPASPAAAPALRGYLEWTFSAEATAIDAPVVLGGGCDFRNYRFGATIGGERRELVLRLPLPETAARRSAVGYPGDPVDMGREFRTLNELKQFELGSPRAFGFDGEGRFFGCPCFCMELMAGSHLHWLVFPDDDPLTPARDRDLMRRYAERIAGIARIPYQRSPWLAANLPRWPSARRMDFLRWETREHAADPLLSRGLDWLRERQPASEPALVGHGDPNPSNFLVEGERIVSVIDWDGVSLIDHPLWAIDIFFGGYFGGLLDAGLGDEYCRAMGRDPAELRWFAVRGLLRDIYSDSGRRWADLMHRKALLRPLLR